MRRAEQMVVSRGRERKAHLLRNERTQRMRRHSERRKREETHWDAAGSFSFHAHHQSSAFPPGLPLPVPGLSSCLDDASGWARFAGVSLKPSQKILQTDALPTPETKLQILKLTI